MPIAGWSPGPPGKARRRPSGAQRGWPAKNSLGRRRPRATRRSPTSMTKTAVSWPCVPRGHGQARAVGRPARRALGVGVVGDGLDRRRPGQRLRRHHGDGVAGAVVGGHGDARAVRREVEVGQGREVRRVGQEVLQLPGGELVAIEVEALRAAVVAGEVQVAAVGRELRAPAGVVVQIAAAARLAAGGLSTVDLPVAAAAPLEGDGVAVGRDGNGR